MNIMKNLNFFLNHLLMLLAAINISCNDKITITDIKLDKDELLLPIGGTSILTANLLPYSASTKINWTTNNNNVATVEGDDQTSSVSKGTIMAKSAGTAIITVATKDGKHTVICTVTVVNPEPELIVVEGGTFTMGCTDDDCEEGSNELPKHQVTLSNYKIAKYTVTQQEWEAVMGNNPSHFKGHDLPIENVNWNNVQEFIQKLNLLTGKNYRLPTEAEWEYAARGGNKSQGFKYSGSNHIDEVAWYKDNSNQTHPVGTKKSNELGIFDMSGNVFEYCSDWYGDYMSNSQINPPGTSMGIYRVVRGGAYSSPVQLTRVSYRNGWMPNSILQIGGFRLVHP
jgi:formylglycine-generating enzyme required for sulfatase activity